MRSLQSAAAALGVLVAGVASAAAGTLETTNIRGWLAGAYTDDTTQSFSRCTMSAEFKSGLTLLFSLDAQQKPLLAFSKPNWGLETDGKRRVTLSVDGDTEVGAVGRTITKEILGVDIDSSSSLPRQLRAGRLLVATIGGTRYEFRLDGTSQAMSWLQDCVRRYQTRVAQQPRDDDGETTGGYRSFATGRPDATEEDEETTPQQPRRRAPAPDVEDDDGGDQPQTEARPGRPGGREVVPVDPDTLDEERPAAPPRDTQESPRRDSAPMIEARPDNPLTADPPRVEARRDEPVAPPAVTPPTTPPADAPATVTPVVPDTKEEVSKFLSTLLSSAGLTGFKILPPEELPQQLRRFPVAWSTPDGIVGIAGIDIEARTARIVSNQMLTAAAAVCNGQFASGTVPSVQGSELVQVFTGCDDGASPIAGRYTIIPRKGGGHFVVGVFSTGSSTPSERLRQVDVTVRDAAIRLVATR